MADCSTTAQRTRAGINWTWPVYQDVCRPQFRFQGLLKLTVNEEKTRVCKVPDETFDFPGLAIGRLYSARTGQARLGYRPSKQSIKRKLRRIHALTAEAMGQQETTALAGKLNCMLRGWANYFVEIQAEVQGAGTVVNTDVLFGYGVGSSGVVASFAGLEMNGDSGDQSQTLSTTLAFTVFMEQGDVIEAFAEGGPEVVSALPVPPALWLFGSGLPGIIGIARRKQAA